MSATKKIWISATVVILLVIGIVIGAGYFTWRNIEARGGVASVLQDALSEKDTGITVSVEKTSFSLKFSAAPLRLIAKNIRLTAEGESLTLPESEFGFSLYNLISGNFVPSDIEISGVEIELFRGSDGWHAGPFMAALAFLMQENAANDAAGDADISALSSIKTIHIGNARVIVNKSENDTSQVSPDPLILEPIDISLQHHLGRIRGRISVNDFEGGEVVVDLEGNNSGREARFSTVISDINIAKIYPYLGLNIPEIENLGQVDGRLTISVSGHGIASFSGDLIARNGKTILPSIGEASYSDASIMFAYDTAEEVLSVTNFDMNAVQLDNSGEHAAGGKIKFSGQVQHLLSNTPVVEAKLSGSTLPFQRILEALPASSNPEWRPRILNTFQGGIVQSFGLNVVGALYRDEVRFDISNMDVQAELGAIRFETGFAAVENLAGTLGTRFELSIGPNGKINHASADVLLLDAELRAKNLDSVVDLEGIELRAQFNDNILTLTRGAIDAKALGQMAAIAKIEIDQDWHPYRLDMSVKAEQVDKDLLISLWPESIYAQTRTWIADRIHGGQINGFDVNVGVDIPRNAPAEFTHLDGKARVVSAELRYGDGMPVLTELEAPLIFKQSFLQADIESGIVAGINVAGSKLVVRNNDQGAMVDADLLLEGPFLGVVKLTDSPQLGLLKDAGLNVTEASGDVNAAASLKWQIPVGGQAVSDIGEIDINATASVINASMDGFPKGLVLNQANADITVADGTLMLSGHGSFNDAPSQIDMVYGKDRHIDLEFKMPESEGLTAILKTVSGVDLKGVTGGSILAKRSAGQNEIDLKAEIDFTEAAVNLDRLGLAKSAGEPAKLTSDFVISNGRLRDVTEFNLESDFLSIKGDANFDESGQFRNASFDEVTWPGNDISQVTVERNEDDVLRVFAEARIVDLTPLRLEDGPTEGVPLIVDLTAERITLDEQVSLSGHVEFETAEDGIGLAKFFGNLFLNDELYMTESTLTAAFGSGNDLLTGRGLIGGAEVNLTLSPSEDGGQLMVLQSNNAGQVLATLDITDMIRSGSLNMAAEFHPDEEGHATINFELEDFNVIEAPRPVRALSVLSLAGLYSLIEGDGTHFDVGNAHIETFKGKQVIHQARVSGNALAVDVVGVIDSEAGELEVSGALLPIYGITQFIGNFPVVSQVLTGVDNSGILVTHFTLTGPIDDPETTINPSSVIPGVFRDIINPNWIDNERENLIGSDQGDDAANDNLTDGDDLTNGGVNR